MRLVTLIEHLERATHHLPLLIVRPNWGQAFESEIQGSHYHSAEYGLQNSRPDPNVLTLALKRARQRAGHLEKFEFYR